MTEGGSLKGKKEGTNGQNISETEKNTSDRQQLPWDIK